MDLTKATPEEFSEVRDFYWDLIDRIGDNSQTVKWEKGVYSSNGFLKDSLEKGDLYLRKSPAAILAAVIVNSAPNPGYADIPWNVPCAETEVLIPHALAVNPDCRGQGIGRSVVRDVIEIAGQRGKKAVRLDVLGSNFAAEKLYLSAGFRFVCTKSMFYEDTGWADFRMYEFPVL